VEISIIEMGANRVGDIAELCSYANPTHGLITNIGDAHSETFGGREGIIRGKSELFDHLRKTGGKVFINMKDEVLSNMKKRFTEPVLYPDSGVKLMESTPFLQLSLNGLEIQTRIVGEYNYENICAAISVAQFFKVPDNKIKEGLEEYEPSNWRSQYIEKGSNKIILDAYNANPTSMKLAIKNLGLFKENKIAVVGGMEEVENSEQAHMEIGESLKEYNIDEVILIGQKTKVIESQLSNAKWFADKRGYIQYLENQKPQNSVILIKASRAAGLEEIEKHL
jgi:UDP-N-acetylmuramoyl-tripeptide--D-alanyl-D-alanine ligase